MSRFSKSTIASLAFGIALVGSGPALAAELTMNLGWETPLDSDYGVLAEEFKKLVDDYSEGSIEVKLRHSGQIGGEDNAFKALQLGTVDAYFISPGNVSPSWPLMDVMVLPYTFENTDHLRAVANGPAGASLKRQLQEQTGVHLLTFGGPSYRDFFNSVRPINTIEDMDGLKIRVPKNKVMLATFTAFGAEPVPLAWSETPTALQTGTIDGGDNGTNIIQEMKFYEYAKYLTVLDHFAGFTPMFVSDAFMKKLSEDQVEAVQRAADEAGEFHMQYMIGRIEEVRTWLATEGGMEVTRPDRTAFIAAAETVQQEVAAERGEAFAALLKEIRDAAK
uniref:TRAP transporter substrate-binding protein n=1 Tax=Pararhizobium sp. IMCC3301 TaxID=3067904 RepID=UPI0027419924|nr:TRAP transporter substrate-binding protein [Pararhizobium sp. IMCC3301]